MNTFYTENGWGAPLSEYEKSWILPNDLLRTYDDFGGEHLYRVLSVTQINGTKIPAICDCVVRKIENASSGYGYHFIC